MKPLQNLRTGLWHFRKGGVKQVMDWQLRRRMTERNASVSTTSGEVPVWPVAERSPRRPALRVGTIMDTFSASAWGYEFDVVELKLKEWREQLEQQPIDLLFVESAWSGSRGSWKFLLSLDPPIRLG